MTRAALFAIALLTCACGSDAEPMADGPPASQPVAAVCPAPAAGLWSAEYILAKDYHVGTSWCRDTNELSVEIGDGGIVCPPGCECSDDIASSTTCHGSARWVCTDSHGYSELECALENMTADAVSGTCTVNVYGVEGEHRVQCDYFTDWIPVGI